MSAVSVPAGVYSIAVSATGHPFLFPFYFILQELFIVDFLKQLQLNLEYILYKQINIGQLLHWAS